MFCIKPRVSFLLSKLFEHEIYIFMPKYPEQLFENIPVKNAFSIQLHCIQLSGNYLYFLC